MTIIREIESATGTEAAELPPLYDVIDLEALKALISSTNEQEPLVEFKYGDVEVAVWGDGAVSVTEWQEE